MIGHMNGSFPDMGRHLPGEMAGLWLPPLKLADGWWFGLRPASIKEKYQAQTDWEWLYGPNCQSFTSTPGGANRTFHLGLNGSRIEACQSFFIAENEPALFISLDLYNPGQLPVELELGWLVRFDIQGSWWSNWPDRPDEGFYQPDSPGLYVRDSLNQGWGAVMQGPTKPLSYAMGPSIWAAEQTGSLNIANFDPADPAYALVRNPAELQGQGLSGQLNYGLSLAPGQTGTWHFVITGDLQTNQADLESQASDLLARHAALWAEKQASQLKLLARTPQVKTPQPEYSRIFDGSALCLNLLTLDTPGLGQAIMGGLPAFAWHFGCDTYYSVSGLLVSGQGETVKSTLRLLATYARRQQGRIPHEITPSGDLFNPGNPIETAEFVTSLERVFRWTGDQTLLEELYPVCVEGIFDYLLGQCDPQGDLLPDGPGLLELSSAEHGKKLDVAAALYQGLQSLAYLAGAQHDPAMSERCLSVAGQVQEKIHRYFWQARRGEYVWRIEADLTSRPAEPAHSYAVLEMGSEHDPDRVRTLFERVEGPEHTGPKGLIHPGTADIVYPIQNAIMALAEFRYGRPDQGLKYLQYCADLYGHYSPWAIPELVAPEGCFIQAWSSAAFNWLSIQGFFRLNPDPLTGTIQVQPQLPAHWNFVQVDNLELWGDFYDLKLERQPDGTLNFSHEAHQPVSRTLIFEVVNSLTLPVSFV